MQNPSKTEQTCLDCEVNKPDPTIVGYYPICRECYDLTITELKEQQKSEVKHPSINEILPNLYLGNEDAANHAETLAKHSIKSILVCGKYLDKLYSHDPAYSYKVYEIEDEPSQRILQFFEESSAWIEHNLKQFKPVLVHCAAGVSRSASFTIAYVMKAKKLSMEEAKSFVKDRRKVIDPNQGFIQQLSQYEKLIKLTKA